MCLSHPAERRTYIEQVFDVKYQRKPPVQSAGMEHVTYRCSGCGNKTRFDVFETITRRQFRHFSLGGEMTVDEEEVFEQKVDKVVCRWCDGSDAIEESSP